MSCSVSGGTTLRGSGDTGFGDIMGAPWGSVTATSALRPSPFHVRDGPASTTRYASVSLRIRYPIEVLPDGVADFPTEVMEVIDDKNSAQGKKLK
jgi:hypothetical protein